MPDIDPEQFKAVSGYVHSAAGITLDGSKGYLIETRLKKLLGEFECDSYQDLCGKALVDSSKKIERKIIDAITTRETLFFRDASPFQLLQYKILPDIIDSKTAQKKGQEPIKLRIWSAACSSGQEVYSIAIALREVLPNLTDYNVHILGTDISESAVNHAIAGRYSRLEVDRGLTPDHLNKYFVSNGDFWHISDDIKKMTSFKRFNLTEPFVGLPLGTSKWDIIFCRNVAIYFSQKDKAELFNKIATIISENGCLIIGATESLIGMCPTFESKRYLRSIFYQLRR